jgi:hypothetical protein
VATLVMRVEQEWKRHQREALLAMGRFAKRDKSRCNPLLLQAGLSLRAEVRPAGVNQVPLEGAK